MVYELTLPGSEIPKWFNHQSVGNYISFWIHRCPLQFFCCVVFKPKPDETSSIDLQVSLKLNGIKLRVSSLAETECPLDMTCNHIGFFMVFPCLEDLNLFERNLVEFEFGCKSYRGVGRVAHILMCGVHVECICPVFHDLSTDTHPPTSIPDFPICSISNTVTPSPHLLNSCLELSNLNSVETTYTFSDTPLEGSHDDGCDYLGREFLGIGSTASEGFYLGSSSMAHNYLSDFNLYPPNNMTDMFESRLGLPGLGIGSTVGEGFYLGSSSMAHNYVSDDESEFNLYPPSKKMRKSCLCCSSGSSDF